MEEAGGGCESPEIVAKPPPPLIQPLPWPPLLKSLHWSDLSRRAALESHKGGGCRLQVQALTGAGARRAVVTTKVTMKAALISSTMVGAGAESMKKLA